MTRELRPDEGFETECSCGREWHWHSFCLEAVIGMAVMIPILLGLFGFTVYVVATS